MSRPATFTTLNGHVILHTDGHANPLSHDDAQYLRDVFSEELSAAVRHARDRFDVACRLAGLTRAIEMAAVWRKQSGAVA